MNPNDLIEQARQISQRGESYAMVTVVRVTPPTSAYVGAQAIVLADGSLIGSVGGGCAKQVVAQAALEAMRSGAAKLVRISNAEAGGSLQDGVEQHPMRCASGGEIELFIHPHQPSPLLLVLGETPTAQQARAVAGLSGFRVIDKIDAEGAAHIDIALVATQGEGDEDGLFGALASTARHVLLVASRKKAERLREAMRQRGVSEARLAVIQAPAGPDIGAHSPAHIALSAVAGAVACLSKGVAAGVTAQAAFGAAPSITASAAKAEPAKASYINPVCGITVDTADARHVLDYAGQKFYFCCDGCKAEFERDPAKYAAIQATRDPADPKGTARIV